MNLQQLRTQVDRRTGVAQDVPAATSYINEAINQISNEREWPWLDATQTITISSSTTYPVPSDYSMTRAMNVNGHEARRIYIADGDDTQAFDDFNEVFVYTIEAGELQFFPQPVVGNTVIHRYVKTEPLLATDTSTPLIPEAHHSVIADLAASLFLERINPTRSEKYEDRAKRGLKTMWESCQRAAGPARIRIRPGAWY